MAERLTPFQKARQAMAGKSTADRTAAAEEAALGISKKKGAPLAKPKPKTRSEKDSALRADVRKTFWGS